LLRGPEQSLIGGDGKPPSCHCRLAVLKEGRGRQGVELSGGRGAQPEGGMCEDVWAHVSMNLATDVVLDTDWMCAVVCAFSSAGVRALCSRVGGRDGTFEALLALLVLCSASFPSPSDSVMIVGCCRSVLLRVNLAASASAPIRPSPPHMPSLPLEFCFSRARSLSPFLGS